MTNGLPMRTLGRTGLKVTHLGYGALELRGVTNEAGVPERAITDAKAETILNEVLDSGINYIDTARRYGASETYIGRYISHRRSEYVLATKTSRAGTVDGRAVWSGEHALRSIDESLTRLQDGLRRRAAAPQPVAGRPGADRPARRAAGDQEAGQGAVGRHLDEPPAPAGPRGRRRVRRLPDQLLHSAARARGLDHQADRGRPRHDHPDAGGQGRARHSRGRGPTLVGSRSPPTRSGGSTSRRRNSTSCARRARAALPSSSATRSPTPTSAR